MPLHVEPADRLFRTILKSTVASLGVEKVGWSLRRSQSLWLQISHTFSKFWDIFCKVELFNCVVPTIESLPAGKTTS